MRRQPNRTEEQQRQYDFKRGVHLNEVSQGGRSFVNFDSAALMIGCSRKTIKRYAAADLFTVSQEPAIGKKKGRKWILIDWNFFESGSDILKNKGRKKW